MRCSNKTAFERRKKQQQCVILSYAKCAAMLCIFCGAGGEVEFYKFWCRAFRVPLSSFFVVISPLDFFKYKSLRNNGRHDVKYGIKIPDMPFLFIYHIGFNMGAATRGTGRCVSRGPKFWRGCSQNRDFLKKIF